MDAHKQLSPFVSTFRHLQLPIYFHPTSITIRLTSSFLVSSHLTIPIHHITINLTTKPPISPQHHYTLPPLHHALQPPCAHPPPSQRHVQRLVPRPLRHPLSLSCLRAVSLELRATLPLRKDFISPLRLPQSVYLNFRRRRHRFACGVGRSWTRNRLGGVTFRNCSYVL